MLQPVKPGERTGREGKPIANRVLLGLEDRAFRALRPLLEFSSFEHHVVLHEGHRKIDRIYFPDDGLVSLVVVMANGRTAEAGVVGKEGIVGLEGLLGIKRGPLREIVQISGKAHSVPAKEMAKLLEEISRDSFAVQQIRDCEPDADFANGRLQPAARDRQASRAMAVDDPGPGRIRIATDDARFPGDHAGYRSQQRQRGGRCFATARNYPVHARVGASVESQGARRIFLRML